MHSPRRVHLPLGALRLLTPLHRAWRRQAEQLEMPGLCLLLSVTVCYCGAGGAARDARALSVTVRYCLLLSVTVAQAEQLAALARSGQLVLFLGSGTASLIRHS